MKKNFSKYWLLIPLIVFVMVLGFEPLSTLAQGLEQGGEGLQIAGTDEVAISGDIDKRPLGAVVLSMVNYFVGFLGFVAVIMFVYAGVLWVVSAGEEEQITKAKKIMTYSAIGIIIIILSFSIVRFIASSAGGGGQTCSTSADCPDGSTCNADNICEDTGGGIDEGPIGACLSSLDCGLGQYCGAGGTCVNGNSQNCSDNSDCDEGAQCDPFGFCHDPNGGSGANCQDNSDCSTGYVCNGDTNSCEVQGTGGAGGTTGGVTQGLSEESINQIDELINALGGDLGDIEEQLNGLPSDAKAGVDEALSSGSLSDKIAKVNTLIADEDDPSILAILEQLLAGLRQLELVREELDELRTVMPESEKTIASWDEASKNLDDLILTPASNIRLRRFENSYRDLKDLIRQFPIVQSRIKATPAQGNVPFTVTFDGLDSSDPTGGTISDYKWSFLDSKGNLISLGNSPVVTHEFTEPNTYSVRLQVTTNNKDASGYNLAMDGVSTVRVKANPPASKVAFRINGVEARDVYHITLEDATAGIAFDPSITTPAIGRTIEKYEWLYGDTLSETRSVPTTVIHSYPKPGEYFVTLKVTDNQGVSDKRVIKLMIKSLAANIEFSPEEGNVNTEFRFRGVNSRSDDGNITAYDWQILDESNEVVASSQQESFYHTFQSPGTYQVELVITDTVGSRDRSVQELTIFSRSPIASFFHSAPDPSHPNQVEFNASSSYDPDSGDKVSYSWDFDGDGQFELVDTQDIVVTHEYRRTGTFKTVLQVQDSFGQRHQVEKNVTIDSILSGDIILEKKAVQLNEEVTFKASSPTAVAYLWEFGDGETMPTEEGVVTHTYTKEGKYKVKLNFFDRDDNDNSAFTFILVGEGDSPIASAEALVNGRNEVLVDDLCGPGKSGYAVTRSDNISFTARNSVNRDGTSRLLGFDWKFSNATRNSKRDFTHRFTELSQTGQCSTVALAVRDEVSGKVSKEDVLYFRVVNQPPAILDFVVEGERLKELVTPTKVRLKIVGAKDLDGQIKRYRWWYYREGFETELLGVHSTTTPETEMIVVAQGEQDILNKYFFVTEVVDNDNGVYQSEELFSPVSFLEIKNGPNLSPVAEFMIDKTTISVGDSISFLSQSYDPQGDELPNTAFQWDFDGDGAFDDSSSGAVVNRQFNTPGEYEVRLRVTHRGLSSTARKTIFVEPTNSYPQATFTYTVDGNTVQFNANNSAYDPDITDNTLRFEWDFNILEDGNNNGANDDDVQSTEVNPTFTYAQSGLYRVRLLVKDSLGMQGVAVRDVNLNLTAAQRDQNTYRSLEFKAPDVAMTTLTISAAPFQVARGNTAEIRATVQNADNSVYTGKVFFELLEGTGEFSPNPVQATGSRAETIFTAVDRGKIRIRVTATGTFYGDITEEVIINVQ